MCPRTRMYDRRLKKTRGRRAKSSAPRRRLRPPFRSRRHRCRSGTSRGTPPTDKTGRQTAEHPEPRIGSRFGAADEPREDRARRPIDGRAKKRQDGELAAAEVLAVDHSLADPVADVQPLQLLASPPVVVPDDEVGFVPDAQPRSKPA